MIKILRTAAIILVMALIVSGCRVQTEPLEEVTITTPEETELTTEEETTAPAPPVGTQVGNLAPDFTLKNLNGENVTLSELRGEPVILNFWATWCYWCLVEMPFLEEIYEEWTEKGLVMLAIDVGESSATVTSFMESNDISLPVLLDVSGVTPGKYNLRGYPTTYFLDKNGVIQAFRVGAFLDKESLEEYVRKITP